MDFGFKRLPLSAGGEGTRTREETTAIIKMRKDESAYVRVCVCIHIHINIYIHMCIYFCKLGIKV